MTYKVKDINLAEQGKKKIKWDEDHYPRLEIQPADWGFRFAQAPSIQNQNNQQKNDIQSKRHKPCRAG
ncbi:hypothetical protein BEH94_11945 [Candidatus Altiarchaeales archaeon WOR_SM1_SCG]|nr:hypothetical protein BEH94_11945 [Candidatus Altiarchaeales archaeon WOR_SM1_SCG]